MKKIILSIALLLAGYSLKAQEIKEWEKEDGNYEATFKKNKEKTDAVFSKEGKLIQTETKLPSPNDLPPAIAATLKKDFAGYEFEESEKIITAEGKELYAVDAEWKEMDYELLFEANGTLVKKTEEKEKKEGAKKK
jgi:hypothetical protein